MRSRLRKSIIALELALFIPGLLWALGYVAFLIEINSIGVASRREKAEVIVVLTGSPERLNIGLALLEDELGDRLFISGVGGGAELNNIYPSPAQQLRIDRFKDRIILETRSTDTETNARETATWLKGQGYKTIRLVTSNYHIPRTRVEFSRVLPPETKILLHPIIGMDMPGKPPRLQYNVAYFLFREYNKFLIAYLRAKTEKSLPIWS